ncbi:MAG: exo-alpha-sialidase [Actinobacteria bacterium]|nr:MAG: exo-alpha-sialidase [Actinomycetota bacterium]
MEADTYSHGSTIESIFQSGRFSDGGADNVGWARSGDGGVTWTHGFFPSTTVFATPPGPYKRATDPAITYDAKHSTWVAVILVSLAGSGFTGNAVIVSLSTDDGLTWGTPVVVKNATGFQSFDSTWVNCDDTPTSHFYGSCYATWDDNGSGNILHVSHSADGGLTWTEGTIPSNTIVIGAKAEPQRNGNVIIATDDGFTGSIQAFKSTNGGASFTGPFSVATIAKHTPAGGIRSLDVLGADVDAAGKVYDVWYDCSFRAGCTTNDIVMSTSSNGTTWTAPVRIPIDVVTSTVDHFLPGIAVKPGTSGTTAVLALTYYFYPQANCTSSTCQLEYGIIESTDGGTTWGAPTSIAGPITLTWLPNTISGFMVGDYTSSSFAGSGWFTVFANARQGNPATCAVGQPTSCNEFMAVNRAALLETGPARPAGLDRPVAGVTGAVAGGLKSTY